MATNISLSLSGNNNSGNHQIYFERSSMIGSIIGDHNTNGAAVARSSIHPIQQRRNHPSKRNYTTESHERHINDHTNSHHIVLDIFDQKDDNTNSSQWKYQKI